MSNLGGIDLFVQILCPESILWPILSDLGVQIWPFLDLFFSLRNGLFFVVFSKHFFSIFTTKSRFYWVYTLHSFFSLWNGVFCSLLNSLFLRFWNTFSVFRQKWPKMTKKEPKKEPQKWPKKTQKMPQNGGKIGSKILRKSIKRPPLGPKTLSLGAQNSAKNGGFIVDFCTFWKNSWNSWENT